MEHRQGDAFLASGKPADAIAAYEKALQMNPLLNHSHGFLTKASRGFYELEGTDSPLAVLYLNSIRINWLTGDPLSSGVSERLAESNRILSNVLFVDFQGSSLQSAILHYSIIEYIRSLVTQGLDAYTAGKIPVGIDLLRKALSMDRNQLHTGFYLAHLQIQMGLVDEAVVTLKDMLELVDHTSIRADLLCTLGDAYTSADRSIQAREAYMQCLEEDSLLNYRAVYNLGGT